MLKYFLYLKEGIKMKKILVLFGGNSFEHNISVRSVKTILENIDIKKYLVTIVGIDMNHNWFLYNDDISKLDENWTKRDVKKVDNIVNFLKGFDKVFPMIHGKDGEDGNIQGMLELFNIPYVGSTLEGHILGYDKEITKIICDKYNIPQLEYFTVTSDKKIKSIELDFPVIVKPAKCGSSIGINVAKDIKELNKYVQEALKFDNKVIVEKFVRAKREFECAVLDSGNITVSSVGEIMPDVEFYDFDAKYVNDTNVMIPAKIDKNLEKEIREYALVIFKVLGLRNLSRIDFLYDTDENKLYFNEVNTLPGFTSISMYPLLFNHDGINTKELITKLIEG